MFPGPPPDGDVDPIFHWLPIGTVVHRIYDPTGSDSTANGFRYEGPFARFDHHIADGSRGIVYGADDVGGCLLQAFGNRRFGYALQRRHATIVIERDDVRLLDLRKSGASAAGTSPQIAMAPSPTAQHWSRFFYSDSRFAEIDGLVYALPRGRIAYAFYDRSFKRELGFVQTDNALSDPAHHRGYYIWARELELTIDFNVTKDPDTLRPGDSDSPNGGA